MVQTEEIHMRRVHLSGSRFTAGLLLAAAVALMSAVAASAATGGGGSGTVGCFNASKTIDSTTVAAHWCWDSTGYLTDLSFTPSQANTWNGLTPSSVQVDSRAGGIAQHAASENLSSYWIAGVAGKFCYERVYYWVHVVGGSQSLDFAETNAEEDCSG
jgi:hypothetical protein